MKQMLDFKDWNSGPASSPTAGVTNFVMWNATLTPSPRLAVTTRGDQMLQSDFGSNLTLGRAA